MVRNSNPLYRRAHGTDDGSLQDLALSEALGGNQTQPVGSPQPEEDPSERDSAVGEWWKTIQPGEDPKAAYQRAYQHFLGREADPEALGGFDPSRGLMNYVNDIYDSEEGKNFRANGGGGVTGGPTLQANPAGFGAYSGFNTGRAQDPSKSAKDAFLAATSGQVGDTRWHTKAGAQEWFTQFAKPALEAQGYQVLEVVGDKARVVTREAREAGNTQGVWIDFVQNADGANPALAWQDESVMGAGGGGGGGALPGAPGGSVDPNTGSVQSGALNLAMSTPQGSFSNLDRMMQVMATNRVLDPAFNLQLGRR